MGVCVKGDTTASAEIGTRYASFTLNAAMRTSLVSASAVANSEVKLKLPNYKILYP